MDTVGMLKAKIRAKLRGVLSTDMIQLIYSGEWLGDQRRLSKIGIDGRFVIGVELLSKPGQLSVTVAEPKETPQRSTSVHEHMVRVSNQLQVVEREPLFEDDIFDLFRFLTMKYYRWSGRRRMPKETRRYKVKWSLTANNMNDIDLLAEM